MNLQIQKERIEQTQQKACENTTEQEGSFMKKAVKRIICIISAICVALSMLLVLDTPVLAATAPQKVHIGLKEFYAYDSNIEVKFSQGDYKVQNVKTSSKNLISRVTNIDATSSKRTYNKDNPWGYARIGLHAKKKGTYTVTFDVVDKNLNVVSSHSVKVYANNEVGVNKVIFAGKTSFTSLPPNLAYGQTAIGQSGSGAFKVSMNKGYSLKSITMVTYKKSGKEVRKKIKNGAKVTLGKYRYISEKTKSSYQDYWNADLLAKTKFEIVYKDKYTGQPMTASCYFYRLPNN